ncbi:hypothetical protein ANCDUO_15014 [Ancylostoma duodenale]|uniref:P2X purinoreceptor 7 intracellular domain-containing protein n=1 Tax=Ancylostoma duodenale TaxID=51022 RepID=A0A0C2CES4_9BILA|nr:hypothetical protein ANCDUO_15014 [Ancylostoma duodenale]
MSRARVPCPVPIGNPDSDAVLSSMRRMNISQVERNPDRDLSYCRLLGKTLDQSRLENTNWCVCGACGNLPTVRENVCCREGFADGLRGDGTQLGADVMDRLAVKLKNACITNHPSFGKVVLDREVLSIWVENKKYEYSSKRKTLKDENRQVVWCKS